MTLEQEREVRKANDAGGVYVTLDRRSVRAMIFQLDVLRGVIANSRGEPQSSPPESFSTAAASSS